MGQGVGGMEKYKAQSSLVWDNMTQPRNGTMSGRKGKNIYHEQW